VDSWNASYQILCRRLNRAYIEKSAVLNGRDRWRLRACDAARSSEKALTHWHERMRMQVHSPRRRLTLQGQLVLHVTVEQLTFFFTVSRDVCSTAIDVTFIIRRHLTSVLLMRGMSQSRLREICRVPHRHEQSRLPCCNWAT
jgi:hypothetical protein